MQDTNDLNMDYINNKKQVDRIARWGLLAFALLFFGLVGYAHSNDRNAVLTWNAPTTRLDGSALDAAEIQHYEICIYYKEGPCVVSEITKELTLSFVDVVPTDASFVYFKGRAVAVDGSMSEWSEVVSKRINPPMTITIKIAGGA